MQRPRQGSEYRTSKATRRTPLYPWKSRLVMTVTPHLYHITLLHGYKLCMLMFRKPHVRVPSIQLTLVVDPARRRDQNEE